MASHAVNCIATNGYGFVWKHPGAKEAQPEHWLVLQRRYGCSSKAEVVKTKTAALKINSKASLLNGRWVSISILLSHLFMWSVSFVAKPFVATFTDAELGMFSLRTVFCASEGDGEEEPCAPKAEAEGP